MDNCLSQRTAHCVKIIGFLTPFFTRQYWRLRNTEKETLKWPKQLNHLLSLLKYEYKLIGIFISSCNYSMTLFFLLVFK